MNDTAWLLATDPDRSIRDGAEAVSLAEWAAELSNHKDPAVLDTLAAAYAEAGRFSEAVKTAEQAIELAGAQRKSTLADSLRRRMKLYQDRSPYRATPPGVPTKKQ